MVNYQNGKIYQLVNDVNNKVYIGSTSQSLCRRMNVHRDCGKTLRRESPLYSAMHEIGIEHFRILLVQNAPCHSKEELFAIEYDTMRQFQQRGFILYNCMIDGRYSEETREKLRCRFVSEETRAKLSKIRTRRGSVTHHKMQNAWRFQWCESGEKQTRNFPVKKYGYDAARGLALYWQEEIYPVGRIDDSKLIREIRARIEA